MPTTPTHPAKAVLPAPWFTVDKQPVEYAAEASSLLMPPGQFNPPEGTKCFDCDAPLNIGFGRRTERGELIGFTKTCDCGRPYFILND